MSRKDYVLLAEAIAASKRSAMLSKIGAEREMALGVINDVAANVATALSIDNERFDRERFLAAALGDKLS